MKRIGHSVANRQAQGLVSAVCTFGAIASIALYSGAAAASSSWSFSKIAQGGLENACYADDEHYVAEFLYQNPDACFYDVDPASETVTALPVPAIKPDAVRMPRPSGGNDTRMLESFINAHKHRQLVGTGTYRVGGLKIKVPVEIHDMPMRPVEGAGVVVYVNVPDVKVFGSPIDGGGTSRTHTGWHVSSKADRFTLVKSGFSNFNHRAGRNVAGVTLRGASDFHLTCNRFDNIINNTSDKRKTARASAVWLNGGNRHSMSGGLIANNSGSNHQSNGKLLDADFIVIQNFRSTDATRPTRIYANRAFDAGKRFTKHQESHARVLSNSYEWDSKHGPLGRRTLLSVVEVQVSNDVAVRNNRIKIGAESRFDRVFMMSKAHGSGPQDRLNFDCNDIEIRDQLNPSSRSYPYLFSGRAKIARSKRSSSLEPTNSSFKNNRVHGDGSVRFHFGFTDGYSRDGGRLDISGNEISIPAVHRPYR